MGATDPGVMRNGQPGKWIIAAAGLLAALAPASKAHGCVDSEALVIIGAAALLVPADMGVALPGADASSPRLVVGWSWQIPLTDGSAARGMRHRLVPEVDLLPHSGGASWRSRLAYRYGRRHVFAGAGVGADGAGVNVSPELGVKFLHATGADDEFDASMHLLARAEIAPDSGDVRGATVLLGWNLF
jgi:hypothetical protein